MPLGNRSLVVVKDLSELRADESAELLVAMAEDVGRTISERLYLVAANHGQLLEKLKVAPQTAAMEAMARVAEELLVTGVNPNRDVQLDLKDLSQVPASKLVKTVVDAMTSHPAWGKCDTCPIRNGNGICPIWENRNRIQGDIDGGLLQRRLTSLVELSEQNGVHFPVRQLLALIANMILGHPDAPDGLMSCSDVSEILSSESLAKASVYRNIFGGKS